MAGSFAGFTLIITIATRLIPVIAVWEVVEHHGHEREARVHVGEAASVPAPGAACHSGIGGPSP